jgi:regulator of cell morphogenesis and NO signaling
MNISNIKKVFPGTKMCDVINDNPYLLLLLRHFEINEALGEKTIEDICKENKISENLFVSFVNMYNGISPDSIDIYTTKDVIDIVTFLENTHQYYLEDQFPIINKLIQKLNKFNDKKVALMIEKFFEEYYKEVIQHLNYEDNVAFPYINKLINSKNIRQKSKYKISDYRKHHDDIAEKLLDLKNILLKYLPMKNVHALKRELLFNLYELEYDLNIHTVIEELILVPLVENFENGKGG